MDTLRAHKMRSALTVFGVVLGVSVIMLVAALITGFDDTIQENIKQFGADTGFVSRWEQGPHGNTRPLEERLRKPLTLADADALKEGCPAIKNVTVFLIWWEQNHTVRTKAGEVTAIDFRGVQPNFGQVYANAATLSGRFISEGDDIHREKVVMLGENVAPVLFPEVRVMIRAEAVTRASRSPARLRMFLSFVRIIQPRAATLGIQDSSGSF